MRILWTVVVVWIEEVTRRVARIYDGLKYEARVVLAPPAAIALSRGCHAQ